MRNQTDLLGGIRPLRLPQYCVTHHTSCDCREAMIRQGLEWIEQDIRTSLMKRDDAPCSSETHLEQALRMCVDLRNRVLGKPSPVMTTMTAAIVNPTGAKMECLGKCCSNSDGTKFGVTVDSAGGFCWDCWMHEMNKTQPE